MTDSSIPDVPAFADGLSPLERAKLGLQDELSVLEIGLLTYPEKDAYPKRERLTDFLLEAIKAGRLAAYGDPEGWYARVSRPNQRPLSERIRDRDSIMSLRPIALGEQYERCNPHEGTRTVRGIWRGFHAIFDDTDFDGDNCLIGRADYLAFLATPAARGIPKPDGWKAPQSKRAAQPETSVAAPVPLSLAERARLGLLADEPELWLHEIMELEFPAFTSYKDREHPDYVNWKKAIEAAIRYGLMGDDSRQVELHKSETHHFPDTSWTAGFLPRPQTIHVVGCSDWRVPRESYRTWRVTQSNIPACSIIQLWLGTIPTPANPAQREPAPLPQGEPDKPEQGAAGTQNPAMNRQCVSDKARFLELATWQGTQQVTVNRHPEAAYFKVSYDMPALLKWASEIDPRPKDRRGGRPRKS